MWVSIANISIVNLPRTSIGNPLSTHVYLPSRLRKRTDQNIYKSSREQRIVMYKNGPFLKSQERRAEQLHRHNWHEPH